MKNKTKGARKAFWCILNTRAFVILGLVCSILFVVFFWIGGIEETGRREVFGGVALTVEDTKLPSECNGKVMIVEVQWDYPGVRIANRPYSFSQSPAEDDPLYRLD